MRIRSGWVCVLGIAVGVGAAIACGSEHEPTSSATPDGGALGADGAPMDGGASNADASGPSDGGWSQCPEEGVDGLVVIEAPSTTIDVDLGAPGQTVAFVAKDKATGQPVQATWSIDAPEAGTIDGNGVFTPNGRAGGAVRVTARYQNGRGTKELTIRLRAVEGAGLVTPQEKSTLTANVNGVNDPGWTIVYPNDETIFPGGTLPPEIHLVESALAPTKYFVHVTAANFDYEGFFEVAPQIAISKEAWDALAATVRGGTAKVEIAKLVAGEKYGPKAQTWRIARGTLHGSIYYVTYDSPLAGMNGAVMRIKGTSTQPEVLVGNCTVCHSLSRDGTTLAAANHTGGGGIFDLVPDASAPADAGPSLIWSNPERAAFAGLSPTGDVFVINGAPGPSFPPNTPGTDGTWKSALMTKAGEEIPDSGIESYYAQSPAFSSDGKMLAFVDREGVSPWSSKLALMHYDPATHQFSGYEVLATPEVGRHLSWPAFSPDGKFIVYQDGTGDDLASWSPNTGKLWMINVQTKVKTPLTRLNGDGAMPAGARDEDLNFYPSFAPVASGGYFWLMFTSRRTYGTRLQGTRDTTKRLWAAAFDVNATDGVDPSHPAFFVPGQELASGNARGSWALDPCKSSGSSCSTGDECCDGFCSGDPQNPGSFVCGSKTTCCAHEFDSCATSADCCAPALTCVAGRCALKAP